MKKLVSFLLVLCILCPLLSGCVYFDKYLIIKKTYLEQFEIKDKKPEDVIVDYDGGTYNGARIVMLDTEARKPGEWTEKIGETTVQYYDTNRLYAYQNGKFFTLTDAYDKDKLSSEDIHTIAEDFNKKVTHFRDTCDKYDFPKGKILEVPENDKDDIRYEAIYIYLSPDLCTHISSYTLIKEYLASDMITDMIMMYGYYNHLEFPDYFSKLIIATLKHSTKECAEYVMKEIVEIPGVMGTSFWYPMGFVSGAGNGTNNSSDEHWWINDIKLEKVWDFTMGSSSVNVGVIDMGIGSSPELYGKIIEGYDFYNNNSTTNDDLEHHGTFVAGIIGAQHNSSSLVAGINKNIRIIPLQVDDENALSQYNNEIISNGEFDYGALYSL